ncbi:MAG: acyltransferase domain-containing protein [Planctomycetaceae bacterium]|nr:acyltransferase domain-containing protein [Planctomycetaceae bacterium]
MTSSSRPGIQERAEDIAIVGMSCLFPGADHPARFWQNIVGKVDCIRDAPPDWQPEIFYDPAGPAIDRSYTRRGGFLGDLCRFQPPKYGVPPVAVDGAEPDQFVALKCAAQALADAGFPDIPLNRAKTGVIMGRGIFVNRGWVTVFQRTLAVDQVVGLLQQLEPHRSAADLEKIRQELKRKLPPANADTFPGLCHSALVGRIANRYDLHGPAYTVDCACSSTLVAVDHALRELRAGRSDAMLVGGTQVSAPAQIHIMFCHLQALSREGKIAPFSAAAEGTVLGQGCGMLLLKRRRDAERDGNRIYALIKAAGVSSDGNGAGLLAPRTEGQQLAIRRAYEEAELDPDSVQLVEAHGTGIPLGDGVEINSLNATFGPRRGPHPDVALGSAKSMVGHLVPGSGAVSLIKTALALYHRVLPPTLHAETPNPALKLDESRFFLCNEPRPWLHGKAETPRRAGVNAFGFGGINAHVVLEEHAASEPDRTDLEREWPCELVVVAAEDRAALARRVRSLASWVEQSTGCTLLDVAASCAEMPGKSRVAIIAQDLADLVKKLNQVAPLLEDPQRERIQDRGGVYWHAQPLSESGSVALVFPGEGSQYPNMLGELCRHFPEVRAEFDLTSRALESRGESLGQVLFPQPAQEKAAEQELYRMDLAVASVTAAARGLWRLLRLFEIDAQRVVGHSSGEYAALLAAGAYADVDEETLLGAIVAGMNSAIELQEARVLPPSTLLSVGGMPDEVLTRVLAESSGDVEVAIDNCPHQRILVGSDAAMSDLLTRLQGKGGLCQRLAWDRPYHTAAFAPACPIVERYFDSLTLRPPRVELWSCATAAPMPQDAPGVRELAVRQWRSKVRFRETIEGMYGAGTRIFIECGPRGNLSAFVADTLGKRPHAAVALDVPNKGGIEQLCRALGVLAAHGVPLRLAELFRRRSPQRLDFDAPPVQAPRPEPVLPLELPLLELSEQFAAEWRSTAIPTAAATEPSVAPAAQSRGVNSNGERRPPSNDALPADPPRQPSPAWTAPAPSAPIQSMDVASRSPAAVPRSVAESAHREFQATMQQFLQTQSAAAAMRGAALQANSGSATALGRLPLRPSQPAMISVSTAAAPALQVASRPPASTALHSAVPPATRRSTTSAHPYPFVHAVLEHRPGERLVAECEWDVDRHLFLRDHTFFGGTVSTRDPQLRPLPVMPLAMSLELIAEVAATLVPDLEVVAFSSIRAGGWLTFPGQTRRVRAIAVAEAENRVAVRLLEADGDGEPEIASARVELGALPETLGTARLPRSNHGAPRWQQENPYARIMYHGPAFQGIAAVEDWGPKAIRARLRHPDPTALLGTAGRLALPVALIDAASQMPGLVYCDVDSTRVCRTFAFPHAIERLEFSRAAFGAQAMTARSTFAAAGERLHSDTEITQAEDCAVLRYLGKLDDAVDVPKSLYLYCREPREHLAERSLNALFAGVPGIERVEIRSATLSGQKILAKAHWARVLAYMILDRVEREEFQRLKLPPVPLADWLLGRMAAKEAVRGVLRHSDYLADTRIVHDPHGRPSATVGEREAALVSLSHKTFAGIAIAARPGAFAGIGLDCEPVQPLSAELLDEALTPDEQQRIRAAAAASTLQAEAWQRAAWGAKEAVGKALGRGVLGGPRSAVIQALDVSTGRITVELRGPLAAAFPSGPQPRRYDTYWRVHEGLAIVICLIETK